ncbi:VQ motif-containing protein 4-like [Phoenix dactylifera]|uniref:VQ motif-containing protein 4-like n=1 Tax=Phoenix dactylifera TaxID=42345 RepID=A0A8B7D3P6_PHODC|nr:VQ motif-containing protein 4-like [Phoenix dactylifera]
MENHQKNPQRREHPSSHPTSPNTTSSSSSSSSNGAASTAKAAAAAAAAAAAQVASPPTLQPPTPKSIPRSIESNPYPTTFIQADTSSFKQVVQMLTGSAETASKHAAANPSPPPPKNPIPPAAKATGPKKPAFKLYERRSGLKNLKMISPLIPTFLNSTPISPAAAGGAAAFSPRKQPEILSPSMLDLPSLALSPVTPLIPDPFNRSPHPNSTPSPAMSAEERAIAEKGFYLHPSPRTTPRDAEPPRLLPLFPVTSPRVSSSSASSP